jgi:hypothetical protein
MTSTSGGLDWISVTYSGDGYRENIFNPQIMSVPFSPTGHGAGHYTDMRTNELGAIILSGGQKGQGIHGILTGDTLAQIREIGLTDRELCQHITTMKGRVSRLDVAIDVHDSDMTAETLLTEILEGRVTSRAKSFSQVQKLFTEEQTVYGGSRSSRAFFRAYNKGEQLHTGEAWLRLELEMKKVLAQAVTGVLAAEPDTRKVINSAIVQYIDFPMLPAYQAAVHDAGIPFPKIGRRITKTYRWLIETVAPALAKYEYAHPDEQVDTAFHAAWYDALENLTRTGGKHVSK